jgi:transposase-like protein
MKHRGYLIQQMARLVKALNVEKAITVKQIIGETGLNIRQVYRWLHALRREGLVDKFGKMPARFRLKKPGLRLVKRTEKQAEQEQGIRL